MSQQWALVVVNYGAHRLLAANLGSDLAGSVVVVDNWRDSAERDAVSSLAAERGWHLVPMTDNQGFGHGANAGARRAFALGAESVVFVNPDARIDPDTIAALARHCAQDTLALVSPLLEDETGGVHFAGAALSLRSGRTRSLAVPAVAELRLDAAAPAGVLAADEVGWLTGACLALHRDLFERTGGFDESLFLYWEDVEFSLRVTACGGHLVVRSDLHGVHDEGGTQQRDGTPAKSGLYYYWNCRNRLALAAVHLGRRDLLRWIAATPRVTLRIFFRGGRRQLIDSPASVWPAVRGSVAGLRLAVAALVRPGRTGTGTGRTGTAWR